ncbi:MAG: homoserine dehydrogenase [Desulfatiglans sp.]|jgi:homoserine dehydrogenase|nr:homoserine dehydrogenase [Thermodesulfobacteriota bacterium]MEE4353831.1 homoserine dehydrogenase [Desulfatiglans sp.]
MSHINVGIIGFGTVGAGTYEALTENRDIISSRVGADVNVKRVADLDIDSDRGVAIDRGLLTTDAMEVIQDPEIDIVVELMGGLGKAKEFILRAMEKGKHVVTANKALLAECGREIYETAKDHGVNLAFEASVCGGIPIISALRRGLAGNHIQAMMGILNGTSNYILTGMKRDNIPYDQMVQEAVTLGFAEDPPTLDVDGTDAAHKLAILVSIAFGAPVTFDDIYREGIQAMTPDDILFADEFGYTIKLLGIAAGSKDAIQARVHPTMIPKGHILANVNEAYNAVYVEGDFVGPNLYYGLGAGRRPTGSAVVSDIMELARQIRLGQKGLMPPLAHVRPLVERIKIQPMEELTSAYYFRFSALDRPGVLSKIAGILGQQEISISSVIQKGREENGPVPIVMLTHEAREKNVQRAISELSDQEILTGKTVVIRVENR